MDLVAGVAAIAAVAFSVSQIRKAKSRALKRDPNSYANVEEAKVIHTQLDLTADFKNKVLFGFVELTVNVNYGDELVLDTRNLKIENITSSGAPLKWKLGKVDEVFGQPLHIKLPSGVETPKVRIAYSTTPESSAVQWLEPDQTAGKVHPYMYTQCQAIHARSLLPCQDTPSVKFPYNAKITVPAPLTALMSALPASSKCSASKNTFSFLQRVPTPAYLIALAIGNLQKQDLSGRAALWTEPEMIEKGAYEFAETETFLKTAEAICGPYDWGRYDLLLLPPSFPYGGMENPCLTFVTPTLLAGDRSNTDVVAHEISHSWMGNLVTCHTWEHFWLNEGWCVFVERKIVDRLYGRQFMNLHAYVGWTHLKRDVERYGHAHPYTALNVKLQGVDPDDAFSSVPYEKGFALIWALEKIVGEEAMAKYIPAHCQKFKFSSLTSQDFKKFFLQTMFEIDPAIYKKLDSFDWDNWFNSYGLPAEPDFDLTLVRQAHDLAKAFADLAGEKKVELSPLLETDLASWRAPQILVMLEKLEEYQAADFKKAGEGKITEVQHRWGEALTLLNEKHHLLESKNYELRFAWISVCIKAELKSALPAAVEVVTSQGRMKFVRPTYRALFASKMGKQVAVDTFKKHKSLYHSIAQKMLAQDLQIGA